MAGHLSPTNQFKEKLNNETSNKVLIEEANNNLSYLKAALFRIVNSKDNLCAELHDKIPRDFNCHLNV